MGPPRLAIVGPGLIGTSVALAAERRWPGVAPLLLGPGDALDALRHADVVVLTAPVAAIVASLPQIAAIVLPATLVIDAGSTKRAIVAAARECGLAGFVGGHPMAGGTASGPGAARADLFDDKRWFLIAGGAAPDAVAKAHAFVTDLGARPVVLHDDGEEHDRVMAAVSHLPQLVATALLAHVGEAVGPEGLAWAGSGLRDTTRIAASSASMWTSIAASNADELAPLLDALGRDLQAVALALRDPAAVAALFARAGRWTDP